MKRECKICGVSFSRLSESDIPCGYCKPCWEKSLTWVKKTRDEMTDQWDETRADAIGQNGNEGEHYAEAQNVSDGSTASYYELPEGAKELQDLISYRNLNAQDGEIFRAIYRKGRASHNDALRDARKVLFYAQAEVDRLERYKVE